MAYLHPEKATKQNKYNAVKTTVGGIKFDSKKEAARYIKLKAMQDVEIISDLELQPAFLLQEKFRRDWKTHRAIKYIADFRYVKGGRVVVEDVKAERPTFTGLK